MKKPFFKKQTLDKKIDEVYNVIKDLSPRDYQYVLNKAARIRPWRPKRKGWANLLDQMLHAGYGAILVLPVLLIKCFWGAALVGLLAGAIREIEQFYNQDLKIRMIFDRIVDISSFVFGASLLYYFLQ